MVGQAPPYPRYRRYKTVLEKSRAGTLQHSALVEEPAGKRQAEWYLRYGNKKAPADMRRRSEGSRGFI